MNRVRVGSSEFWDDPAEGATAVELWAGGGRDPYGYALIPLLGDWRTLFTEPGRLDEWRTALAESPVHVHFDRLRLNQFSAGSWEQVLLWSEESGVVWPASTWFYPFKWAVTLFERDNGWSAQSFVVFAEDSADALDLALRQAGPEWVARPWVEREGGEKRPMIERLYSL